MARRTAHRAPTRPTWFIVLLLLLVLICPLAFMGFAHAQTVPEPTEEYGDVIGIDLGTTYSCVGVVQNGKVEILANDQGHRITPSYVAFTDEGRLVGDAAKNQYTSNPGRTIYDIKRLIGRTFDDRDVQQDLEHLSYAVRNGNGKPVVDVEVHGKDRRTFTPEEISAMILGKMKDTAESYLGRSVTHAIVTVPAYFNDAQRQATKDAGAIAGLNILRIVNEPTAAAIAYSLDRGEESRVLVFDLGGGTIDVSLLEIEDGVIEVLATAGDTHLGGEDFDQRVIDYLAKEYNLKYDVKVQSDAISMGKLKREVELAKRTLSSQSSARIEIEAFHKGQDLSETLTRSRFEELNRDLFKKTLEPVRQVLKDAGVKKSDINEIVLVGGSTRIPVIQSMIGDFFDGKKANKNINPDEAVAYGATILAGILTGDLGSSQCPGVLIDVNPLTLGIETNGGVMAKLIPRNTIIPTVKSQIFSTATDNQPAVMIKIFEGEQSKTKENNLLGNFELTGIPPAPRGVPQIAVRFEIDADGILKVTAADEGTGKSSSITVSNDNRLKYEEIERMIMDAEVFTNEDKLSLRRSDAQLALETYMDQLGGQLEQGLVADKLVTEDKQAIHDALESTRAWYKDSRWSATAEELEMQKLLLSREAELKIRTLYADKGDRFDDNWGNWDHDEL